MAFFDWGKRNICLSKEATHHHWLWSFDNPWDPLALRYRG